MIGVFLQDGEYAGRRIVPFAAGRAGRDCHQRAMSIDIGTLFGDRNDDDHGAVCRLIGSPGVVAGFHLSEGCAERHPPRLRPSNRQAGNRSQCRAV